MEVGVWAYSLCGPSVSGPTTRYLEHHHLPFFSKVPVCGLTCTPLAVFADCTPLPHSAVSWCLPPSIAGECLQTPIVPHGTSQGPLLCADGGHAVCPGRSLLTGRLRAAGQSSEGCTSGACAPWRGPRTRSSHSLGWLAAPSQVNLRIVPGLTLWAEQEVLDFFLSLHPSPGRLLNTPFPLSFWGGRRSQGLKAGEGLLEFTPQEAAGHSEPHQKLKARSLAD